MVLMKAITPQPSLPLTMASNNQKVLTCTAIVKSALTLLLQYVCIHYQTLIIIIICLYCTYTHTIVHRAYTGKVPICSELNVPSCKWYDVSGHDLLGGGVELIVQSGFRLREKDNPTSEIRDSSGDSEITGLS